MWNNSTLFNNIALSNKITLSTNIALSSNSALSSDSALSSNLASRLRDVPGPLSRAQGPGVQGQRALGRLERLDVVDTLYLYGLLVGMEPAC